MIGQSKSLNRIFIKRKSSIVIILSCLIIALVFIFTLAGIYIYLNYKEDNNEKSYRSELYELNASINSKSVTIQNPALRVTDTDKILISGKIVNNSNKNILSIKLKAVLVDKDGRILYMENLYPLYYTFYNKNKTRLLPAESVSFSHMFRRCPKYLVKEYKKNDTNNIEPKFWIEFKITELIIE